MPNCPRGWAALGDLLRDQGDVDGARAAFQRAIDSGHADIAAFARKQLSRLQLWTLSLMAIL